MKRSIFYIQVGHGAFKNVVDMKNILALLLADTKCYNFHLFVLLYFYSFATPIN